MATKKANARHRAGGLSDEQALAMYWHLLLAHRLDERMWILHRQHEIAFHISGIGHEGTHVGAAFALKKGYGWVHSCYRDLAVALTLEMTPRELMLGVYGKEASHPPARIKCTRISGNARERSLPVPARSRLRFRRRPLSALRFDTKVRTKLC